MKSPSILLLISTILVHLSGCGGGGGTDAGPVGSEIDAGEDTVSPLEPGAGGADPVGVQTGFFVDSAVANLSWSTESLSGTTGEDGGYQYMPGEKVTFSYGEIRLPEVEAKALLTPLDMTSNASNKEHYAVNLARLLITMDVDGNPENGIELPSDSTVATTAIEFDMESNQFGLDSNVRQLVERAGGVRQSLVSVNRTREHFGRTLAASDTAGSMSQLAGIWQVELSESAQPGALTESGVGTVYTYDSRAYLSIAENGEFAVFSRVNQSASACHTVEHSKLVSIDNNRYIDTSPKLGGMKLRKIIVSDDQLNMITEFESESEYEYDYGYSYTETTNARKVSDVPIASLALCAGESLQPNPQDSGVSASVAGLWEFAESDETGFYQLYSHGVGERLVQKSVFGPAPDYTPAVCYEPVELQLIPKDSGSFEVHHARSWAAPTKVIRPDDEFLAVRSGDADPSMLSRSEIAPATLNRCGAAAQGHPLDEISGLWRNEGDGIFGHYVVIDRDTRTMKTLEPGLGGLDCFVETSSSLTAEGGLDFTRQLADGSESRLRMQPGADRLVIAEIDNEENATPVRWLEEMVGLEEDVFSMCQVDIQPQDLAAISPLAGVWSRTSREYNGPYGPDRSTIVYERTEEYWTIGDAGRLDRQTVTTELLDRYDGKAEYRTCRNQQQDPVQIDPVAADVYRVSGSAWTMNAESDQLSVGTTYEDKTLQRSDVDLSVIEHCNTDTGLRSSNAFGLWLLEPFNPGEQGKLMSMRYGDLAIHEYDLDENCSRTSTSSWQELSDNRYLLSSRSADGVQLEAVANVEAVEDELRIVMESADEAFPIPGGTFPRVRGLSMDHLIYGSYCY